MADAMWSPTKARLNRRRNKAAKLQLDLSAHIKGEAPLTSAADKKKKSKDDNNNNSNDDGDLQKRIETTIAGLPAETQKLLEIIKNKDEYSVRERVQAEVELNKDVETAQLMKDMKYIKQRKSLLNYKNRSEEEQAKIMEQLIKEEEERERQEKLDLKQKKEQARKEKKEAKERQAKALRDAKKQAAAERAKDAEALKSLATATKKKVEEKIELKIKEEQEHEAFKEDLLQYEDSDVIRALKEARLDQKDINTKNA